MKELTEYLQNKIDTVRLRVGFDVNVAIQLLLFDKSDNTLETYMQIAIQEVLSGFQKSDIPGFTKLTNTSTKIGQRILEKAGKCTDRFDHRVKLGDLFLEAMMKYKYISIQRDPAFSENSRTAPYVIEMLDRWEELAEVPMIRDKKDLRGTVTTTPNDLTLGSLKRTRLTKETWNEVLKDSVHIKAGNKLQQVKYRVNLDILNILEKNKNIFISEDSIVIPKEGNKSKMDNAYSAMRMCSNRDKGKISDKLISLTKDYEREAKLWNLKLHELKRRSRRTEFKYTLQKASLLAEEPKFHQLVEMDYRGRFYYIEPFFNYQCTDVAKGLMEFHEAKTLDKNNGVSKLAIHTASSYNMSYDIEDIPQWCQEDYRTYLEEEGLDSISVDKMTLNDRQNWTENNYDLIMNLAVNQEIDMKAEKPMVFLACCIEWKRYTEEGSSYKSRLPIPIDGSNNGWQHLGAISKDEKTGELVGLIPSLIQKDFYVQTGKELVAMLPEWFNERNMPMKHIRKGLSKRGSMTRAYSAGEKTMGINMYADCWAEDFTSKYNIDISDCNKLAHHLIKAINKVCPGPLKTMGYLQALASFELGRYRTFKDDKVADKKFEVIKKRLNEKRKLKEDNDKEFSDLVNEIKGFEKKLVEGNGSDTLSWVTPSGFPVLYRKFLMKSLQCKGTIKGIGRISHKFNEETKVPDIRGYLSGISPNFTHGNDGAHMALSVDGFDGDFAGVHDSFSTHASDVEELLRVTKSTFIEMYDKENYYEIMEKMILSNSEGLMIEQPEIGNLDIKRVEDSDYFFA